MSGFIANGTTAAEHTIDNDAFWPDIDCLDLRAAMRLDASVTPERIEAAAINAMIEANRELATQLLSAADLWLFVTTAARYAEPAPAALTAGYRTFCGT